MIKPIWTEPIQLEQDFKAYIDYCNYHHIERNSTGEIDTANSIPREIPLVPTITGFCCFRNIHRDTYYEYKNHKNGIFSDVIKMTEQYIEEMATQKLMNARNPAGTIFYLKNKLDWADKREITTNSNNVTNVLNISTDQLDSKIAALLGKDNSPNV